MSKIPSERVNRALLDDMNKRDNSHPNLLSTR